MYKRQFLLNPLQLKDELTSIRPVSYTQLDVYKRQALCRLLAPILAFTADEAWEYAGYEGSVHEQDFPAPMPEYDTQEASLSLIHI